MPASRPYTPGPAGLDRLEQQAASPAPVVIDHCGPYAGAAPGSAAGRGLLALLRLPHVWMKLSAPYRAEPDPLAVRPDPAWLAAILAVAAGFRAAVGSDELADRIMADNPCRLYGF